MKYLKLVGGTLLILMSALNMLAQWLLATTGDNGVTQMHHLIQESASFVFAIFGAYLIITFNKKKGTDQ